MKDAKPKKARRPLRVYQLDNGTVIDHIANGQALRVIRLLGLGRDSVVAVGMNFDSEKLGRKDLVKVENLYLTDAQANKVALVAPEATVNIIRRGKLVKKHAIAIPEELVGLLRCSNPRCITNHEAAATRFRRVPERARPAYRCAYCERVMEEPELAENLS
jgi:aspartate carbamoyltransferase regulatory subunit